MTITCNGTIQFFGYILKYVPYPQSPPMWLYDLVQNLFLYLTPVYLVIGTLGNILSVIVFLRPAMKELASRSRFILISVMDVIILYGCMLIVFLDFGNFVGFCNLEFGYINMWIQSSLMMTDSWILALVSLERTLAIFRPLSTWTNNENRKRCCSWINSLLIALPFICFFLCLPQMFDPLLRSTIFYRFADIVAIIDTFLTTAVPFFLILCLDIAILIKLYGFPLSRFKKENKRDECLTRKRQLALRKKVSSPPNNTDEENITQSKTNKRKKEKARDSQVTSGRISARFRALKSIKMMLAVDMLAILLNMPIIVLVFLQTGNTNVISIAHFSVYTRHAINFFFYFISSQFRHEAISILRCHFRRPVSSGASNISLSTVSSRVNM